MRTNKIISGITFTKDQARVIVRGIMDPAEFISLVLVALSDANIELDLIMHNKLFDDSTDFTFTIEHQNLAKTTKVLASVLERFEKLTITTVADLAKISIVGLGLRSNPDVISKIFKVFSDQAVDIQLITTAEIKVSVLMDEKYIESMVKALHKAFQLDNEQVELLEEVGSL